MLNIATLTLNPTIDTACEVDRVTDTRKLRATGERHDPGGGGINVARVFVRLGGNARCYYLSGGATGVALDGLLDLHQLVRTRIEISGHTRVSTTVHETSTGLEYRFVPGGPAITESEWRSCLDQLAEARCDYLVASGSLPVGVPEDFYARIAAIAQERGFRLVLDTSGAALAAGLSGGGVYLAKPSIEEFRALVGSDLTTGREIEEAAMDIIKRGGAEILAITMGSDGALLADRTGTLRLPAIAVETRSAVGAGDSFVAAMVYALGHGDSTEKAFRYGLAAGAAAVLTPGTDMCRADDVERLFKQANALS